MNEDIDDLDADGEFGFEPAVSVTGADDSIATPKQARRLALPGLRLRRRVGAGIVMIGALASMGGAYAMFATSSDASNAANTSSDLSAGQQLYETSCITCHGANLEGVQGQGPPLIGVGSAAVYFQVSTGRMPAIGQGSDERRKEAKFDETQTDQIGDYVESVGGGPTVPTGNLRVDAAQIGKGGELFRLNCASCHGATGKGAPLTAGKVAPSLNKATDKQIYAAMLSGPANMPLFSNNTISPSQKKQILTYIQTLKASQDPGGNGIDRIGPVSEAVVIWVAGVGALMITILWIGARAR